MSKLRTYYAEVDLTAPLDQLPEGSSALDLAGRLVEAFDFTSRAYTLDADFAHDAGRDVLTICLSGVRATTAIDAALRVEQMVNRSLAKGSFHSVWQAYFDYLRASSQMLVRVERSDR